MLSKDPELLKEVDVCISFNSYKTLRGQEIFISTFIVEIRIDLLYKGLYQSNEENTQSLVL